MAVASRFLEMNTPPSVGGFSAMKGLASQGSHLKRCSYIVGHRSSYTPAKSSSLLINTTHWDANSMVGPRLIFSVPSRFKLLKLFFGMGM